MNPGDHRRISKFIGNPNQPDMKHPNVVNIKPNLNAEIVSEVYFAPAKFGI